MDESYPESVQVALDAIKQRYHLHDQGYVLEAIDEIIDKNWTGDDKVALIAAVLDAHEEAKG
jgi:hypothetical protein